MRVAGRILVGAGIGLLCLLGWTGWRLWQAYEGLTEVERLAQAMVDEVQLHGLDRPEQLRASAHELADAARAARSASSDSVYRFAENAPILGKNLTAVRIVAASADEAVRLTPDLLDEVLAALDGDLWADGQVDLVALGRVVDLVERWDADLQSATAGLVDAQVPGLLGPVEDGVLRLDRQLARVAGPVHEAARWSGVLPGMLGDSEPRNYLVVFQNSAEPRATGGIFGQWIELGMENGRPEVRASGSTSRDLGRDGGGAQGVPQDTVALYTDRVATDPLNVNLTPDFPTAASGFADIFEDRTGRQVDAVLAVDLRLVEALVRRTAPITLPGGDGLEAEEVVPFLLSDVYRLFPDAADSDDRDGFLAAALLGVVQQWIGGDVEPAFGPLLADVAELADQRRILWWSRDVQEQAVLLSTAMGGRLPDVDPPGTPTLGLFVNDGTGSKLGYYLKGEVQADVSCAGGSVTVLARATLTYRTPPRDLPAYVRTTVLPGDDLALRLNVMFYAPTAGAIVGVTVDGAPVPVHHGTERGRAVAMATVELPPGGSSELLATVELPASSGAGASTAAGSIVPQPLWRLTPLVEQITDRPVLVTEC